MRNYELRMESARKRNASALDAAGSGRAFKLHDSRPQKQPARKFDRIRHQSQLETQRMQDWVSQEDNFALSQLKFHSLLRIAAGRGILSDFVLICTVDARSITDRSFLETLETGNYYVVDPAVEIEQSTDEESLTKALQTVKEAEKLEKGRTQREYLLMVASLISARLDSLQNFQESRRMIECVEQDVESVLIEQSFSQLVELEEGIKLKLTGTQPTDLDYWTLVLSKTRCQKAKYVISGLYKQAKKAQLQYFVDFQLKCAKENEQMISKRPVLLADLEQMGYKEPELVEKLQYSDRNLERIELNEYIVRLAQNRSNILKQGFILMKTTVKQSATAKLVDREEGFYQEQLAILSRNLKRMADDEEDEFPEDLIYQIPVELQPDYVKNPTSGMQIRKPKFFNRIVKGIEWNQYNTAHYTEKNPPAKVVQGYRFHIFYPALKNSKISPTFQIIRDAQLNSLNRSGEPDLCVIKFIAGPPYEDLAFKIVDNDWDYAGKYDRKYKSHFDNGVLILHFMYKKQCYRN